MKNSKRKPTTCQAIGCLVILSRYNPGVFCSSCRIRTPRDIRIALEAMNGITQDNEPVVKQRSKDSGKKIRI